MRAVRYNLDDKKLFVSDISVPEPLENEVLIKVAYCGICGSDLSRYRLIENPPIEMRSLLGAISPVPGHEFCGTIEQWGSGVPSEWKKKGLPVLAHPLIGCGKCRACLAKCWNRCEGEVSLMGLHRNGGFTEYAAVPFDHLIAVKDGGDESLKAAAVTEPLAVALHMFNLASPRHDEKIVVIGDGAIGILISALLSVRGFGSVLIAKHKAKADIARRMGVENIVSDAAYNASCVFHTAGSQSALEMGLDSLNPGGRMVCIGYLHANEQMGSGRFNSAVRKELSIIGSYSYSYDDMSAAYDIINSEIDVSPIISRIVPLEDTSKGFEALVKSKLPGKVLVDANFR